MTNRESFLQTTGKSWNLRDILEREWRLLRVIIVILVLMNIPYGRYVLSPFIIFSTWIHELCHGIAAILMGGEIIWLHIYKDGSGLAYNQIPRGSTFRRVFVASAGYTGTALVGFILLLFRRTKRGPRIGIIGLGSALLLSCALVVRNAFGLAFLIPFGLVLTACGLKLPSQRMRDLYVLLAAACSLNAITSIHDLFGSSCYVNGQPTGTDAHTVADLLFLPYWFWASLWLVFAVVMTIVGFVFAVEDPNHVEEDDLQCCGAENT